MYKSLEFMKTNFDLVMRDLDKRVYFKETCIEIRPFKTKCT